MTRGKVFGIGFNKTGTSSLGAALRRLGYKHVSHNSKMLVSEGQTVTKGQKIAEIGESDADHPKLHFEIRREGKPVDPGKYLPSR